MPISNSQCINILFLIILSVAGFGEYAFSQSSTDNAPMPPFRFAYSAEAKRQWIKEIEFWLLDEDFGRIQPPIAYYAKFSNLLSDKKINLARLYPDRKCYEGKTVSVNEIGKCVDVLPLLGDGSYYSFRLKTNVNQKWDGVSKMTKSQLADIKFTDGNFVTGSEITQGVIADLGKRDFNTLTSDSVETKLLQNLKIEKKLSRIASQKAEIKKGIQLNEYNFTDSAPVSLDSLYILRSVAFQAEIPGFTREEFSREDREMLSLYWDGPDLRLDIIVAFKLVGQEKDGSLIILWKELKRKKGPTFKS